MLERKQSRLGGTAILMLVMSHCVLPNEELDPAAMPNQAPLVDIDSALPGGSVIAVDVDCPSISLQVLVDDLDDFDLRLRWVVRDVDATRFSFDTVAPGTPGTPRRAENTFTLSADEFDDIREQIDNPVGSRTAFITLYVTDSPSWSIANPNIPGQGQKTTPGSDPSRDYPADFNLGAIPTPDETGGIIYSVTTYSWSFEFNDRGLPCP